MSSATVEPFPLGSSYGAELLATFVSVALWGTTCMQTLVYFVQYPNDNIALKALVWWLWITDTVHQALLVDGVYTSQITDFCNYARVSTVVPEFLWQLLLTSLVAIPSQVFFTYRIWRFAGRRWIYFALLAPVAAFELGGALAFLALGTITPTAAELVSYGPASVFTAVQAVAAAVDITISSGLVYLLYRSREQALRGSRTVIQKLVILTINTGMWTALFAIFTFVTILAFKNTLIYAALYFPLCPLYCNTVLANLNARELLKVRSVAAEVVSGTRNIIPVFATPRNTTGTVTQSTDPTISTQVCVAKSTDGDDYNESMPKVG
ncbi:hypothetical protein PAXRUDRAFT_833871 [Paxillus rubicundulus Ve08.2h10]|uniref:DUF6534 domain-containing protein n=1 Tax=Paxillus rubicundulus Ve08.2h10 TaxID=930991 RepID=A0A0D0DN26_9AGAM|nr:hypothetical protein PAXRUDRAFT_833871 [Paxillus rubicundulus Ve08.2h10]